MRGRPKPRRGGPNGRDMLGRARLAGRRHLARRGSSRPDRGRHEHSRSASRAGARVARRVGRRLRVGRRGRRDVTPPRAVRAGAGLRGFQSAAIRRARACTTRATARLLCALAPACTRSATRRTASSGRRSRSARAGALRRRSRRDAARARCSSCSPSATPQARRSERYRTAAFRRRPDLRYALLDRRCSSMRRGQVTFAERTFDADGDAQGRDARELHDRGPLSEPAQRPRCEPRTDRADFFHADGVRHRIDVRQSTV